MQILELTLLGLSYTILSIALFLSIICYKRKIDQIETVVLISSLLLLIISVSLSPLFQTEPYPETSTFTTLLCMVLVSESTFFNVLAERKHQVKKVHKMLFLSIGVLLVLITIIMFFLNNLALIEPAIVVFLMAAILGSMLILKFSPPVKTYAHQAKMDNIFSIGFGILIPVYLILHFGFEDFYNSLQIGFLIPAAFSVLGINKIYDDLKRLSLLKTKENPQKQHFTNFGLTEREEEVALLLIRGKTYQQISEQLFVSLPTVKTHAGNIYKKCRVKSRHELTTLINN